MSESTCILTYSGISLIILYDCPSGSLIFKGVRLHPKLCYGWKKTAHVWSQEFIFSLVKNFKIQLECTKSPITMIVTIIVQISTGKKYTVTLTVL